jgi:hypothetical protein
MKKNNVQRLDVGFLGDMRSGGTDDGQDCLGHLVVGAGSNAALSLAVEEIFLEGENATVLRHEPGSDHAKELISTSGIWRIQDADD